MLADSYRRESLRLRELLRLVGYIRVQIDGFHTPLGEIYERFDDGAEIAPFLTGVREVGFEAAAKDILPKLDLSERTRSILTEFAAWLGKSDASDQVKRCLVCEEGLSDELKRCETALPGKLRVCRTLALSFAIMTVILLI